MNHSILFNTYEILRNWEERKDNSSVLDIGDLILVEVHKMLRKSEREPVSVEIRKNENSLCS